MVRLLHHCDYQLLGQTGGSGYAGPTGVPASPYGRVYWQRTGVTVHFHGVCFASVCTDRPSCPELYQGSRTKGNGETGNDTRTKKISIKKKRLVSLLLIMLLNLLPISPFPFP
jgi:hypothetical protein